MSTIVINDGIQFGRDRFNIQELTTVNLTKSSPIKTVAPKEVRDLWEQNQHIAPSSFEKFRAKVFSVIVGGALPVAIAILLGFAIYKVVQTSVFASAFSSLSNSISAAAQKVFTAITSSGASLAASAGGVIATSYIVTRPAVYDAIASFVGSLLGSFTGTSLAHYFNETQTAGYNWCYDSYKFDERTKKIENNNETIIKILTETYDDIALDLEKSLSQTSSLNAKSIQDLKSTASNLSKRIPIIQEIFDKHGIPHNKSAEITLKLEKSVGEVLDFQLPIK